MDTRAALAISILNAFYARQCLDDETGAIISLRDAKDIVDEIMPFDGKNSGERLRVIIILRELSKVAYNFGRAAGHKLNEAE